MDAFAPVLYFSPFLTDPGQDAFLSLVGRPVEKIRECPVDIPAGSILWIDSPHREGMDKAGAISVLAVQKDRFFTLASQKSPVLLTGWSVLLPWLSGLEMQCPDLVERVLIDTGYGRSRGFSAFGPHPVFQPFNNGIFVFDPPEDSSTIVLGHFDGRFPSDLHVTAVERSYITVHDKSALVWENKNPATATLSVGGFIDPGSSNKKAAHAAGFVRSCLRYLSDYSPEKAVFWPSASAPKRTRPEKLLRPVAFSGSNDLPRPGCDEEGEHLKPGITLFSTGSRGFVVAETGKNSVDEWWIHPVRAFSRIVAVAGKSADGDEQNDARVEIMPRHFVRTFGPESGALRERVVSSPDRPGGAVNWTWNGKYRTKLTISWETDLRRMWPFPPGKKGDLTVHRGKKGQFWSITNEPLGMTLTIGLSIAPERAWTERCTDRIESPNIRDADEGEYIRGGFEIALDQGESVDLGFVVEESSWCSDSDPVVLKTAFEEEMGQAGAGQRLKKNALEFLCPDSSITAQFSQAVVAVDSLFAETPGLGAGYLAGYGSTERGWDGAQFPSGRPGYAWYFGRDAEWIALAVLGYGDLDRVEKQIELLLDHQDLDGKIIHELTTSGAAHYDAADSTPLLLILVAEWIKRGGNPERLNAWWPGLLRAQKFLLETDTDNDGLIENTGVGHGWIEGGALFGAHVTLYMASIWLEALRAFDFVTTVVEDHTLTDQTNRLIARVSEHLNQTFWNDDLSFPHYGMLGDGSMNPEPTVLAAVPLLFGQFDLEKVDPMLDRLSGIAFSSDWGARILPETSDLFNPKGYHYGTVWPLFSGWMSLAMYRYGRSEAGFFFLTRTLKLVSLFSPGYVEEVLHGLVLTRSGVCSHQGWSASMAVQPMIEGLLGFRTGETSRSIRLEPRLPVDWDHLAVRDMRCGGGRFDVELERDNNRLVASFYFTDQADATIRFAPELPLGCRSISVSFKGIMSEHFLDDQRRISPPVYIEPAADVSVVLDSDRGIGIVPICPELTEGMASSAPRIVKTVIQDDTYIVVLEGYANTTNEFEIRLFDADVSRVDHVEGWWFLNDRLHVDVRFMGSSTNIVQHEIRVVLNEK